MENEKPARQPNNTQDLEENELKEDKLPAISDNRSDLEEYKDDYYNMEVNSNLKAIVPKVGIISENRDLEAIVPKVGTISEERDLEAIVPKVGIIPEDLEAIVPKVGNVQVPTKKDLESEPPSDPAKNPNTKTEKPGVQKRIVQDVIIVDVLLRKSRRIRRLTRKAKQI